MKTIPSTSTEQIPIRSLLVVLTATKQPKQQQITLFFGKRKQETLRKFNQLSNELRRSRTGTLDFLITHYEWYEHYKKVSL